MMENPQKQEELKKSKIQELKEFYFSKYFIGFFIDVIVRSLLSLVVVFIPLALILSTWLHLHPLIVFAIAIGVSPIIQPLLSWVKVGNKLVDFYSRAWRDIDKR